MRSWRGCLDAALGKSVSVGPELPSDPGNLPHLEGSNVARRYSEPPAPPFATYVISAPEIKLLTMKLLVEMQFPP